MKTILKQNFVWVLCFFDKLYHFFSKYLQENIVQTW